MKEINRDTSVRMFRLNGTSRPDFIEVEISEDQCEELVCPECGDSYFSPNIADVRMACGKGIDFLPDHDMLIESNWDSSQWRGWAGTSEGTGGT